MTMWPSVGRSAPVGLVCGVGCGPLAQPRLPATQSTRLSETNVRACIARTILGVVGVVSVGVVSGERSRDARESGPSLARAARVDRLRVGRRDATLKCGR